MENKEILTRLQCLEDEKAILDLLHRYCIATDHGTTEEWVSLFLPDAAFDVIGPASMLEAIATRGGSMHATGIRFTGREQLARFTGERNGPRALPLMHATIRPFITIDGDDATSLSYYICIANHGGNHVIYAMGRFIDRLKRDKDAGWKFAERVSVISAAFP